MPQMAMTSGGRARWPVSEETHQGVRILRANGSRFRPRRFAGRAANYVSYFASAALASLRADRPDVVVSLTDPPIIGLAARWTARRLGARFVFLCEDMFPEVAALLEDFHNPLLNRALDRTNRYLLREADAIVALGDCMQRRLVEEKGADPARTSRDPQLGRLRSDRARRQGQRLYARARSRRSLRADALGEHRDVAESRRAHRRGGSAAVARAPRDPDRRRGGEA